MASGLKGFRGSEAAAKRRLTADELEEEDISREACNEGGAQQRNKQQQGQKRDSTIQSEKQTCALKSDSDDWKNICVLKRADGQINMLKAANRNRFWLCGHAAADEAAGLCD